MQLHKPVMTFTASSPPAFRSSMGIPSHPADFRSDICLSASFTSVSITSGSSSCIYVFVEGVRCVWVPSVELFRALLPYFFHLLLFRYHLPRDQLHGSTSFTVGSCNLFDFSEQVSLVLPILLLSSICLHFSFRLCSLSCLALLWKAAFRPLHLHNCMGTAH